MSFYSSFAAYYDKIFPLRPNVLAFIESYLPETGRVLDVGCGTGRYAGHLAASGFSSLGIDRDVSMVTFARRQFPQASFCCMNMQDICFKKPFDLIFCVGNVLAHLEKDLLPTFLHRIKSLLNPRGHWIFQVKNWDFVLQQKTYSFPVIETGPPGHLQFHRSYSFAGGGKVVFTSALLEEKKPIFRESVTLHPVVAKDYLRLHEAAGLTLKGHFCDFEKNRFSGREDKAGIFVYQNRG